MAGPRVAFISMHTAPGLTQLGRGDSGGLNLVVRRLTEELGRRDVPGDIFTRDDGNGPAVEMISEQSRLIRIKAGPPEALLKSQQRPWIDEFARGIEAHADSQGITYDLIHSHFWLSGMAARRLSWDVPRLQSFHSLGRAKAEAGLPLDTERDEAEHQLVAGSDRLVTNSGAEACDLMRLYAANAAKIAVVRPGTDVVPPLPRRDEARRQLRLSEPDIWLLFAGRLDPVKGLDVLLQALSQLPDSVRLCVIGEESSEGITTGQRHHLQQLAARLGVLDRVEFRSAVPHHQLHIYYAAVDLCVMPSLTETFGLVALEAQAAGLPVVASDAGGLREIVRDGKTGRLVPASDHMALAAAVGQLTADPAMRRDMGAEAREQAAGYTWARSADALLDVYRRCLEDSGAIAAAG